MSNIVFEAYTYDKPLGQDILFIHNKLDSYESTDTLLKLIATTNATKCVNLYNQMLDKFTLEVIIDPEKIYALRGQMVNPYSHLTKDEIKEFSRLLRLKNCIIRLK